MLPTKIQFIFLRGFRGNDFFKSTYHIQRKLYVNGFYQVSVHLTKWTVAALLVNGSGLNKQFLLKSFRSTDTSY
jgi:hypothetical protein